MLPVTLTGNEKISFLAAVFPKSLGNECSSNPIQRSQAPRSTHKGYLFLLKFPEDPILLRWNNNKSRDLQYDGARSIEEKNRRASVNQKGREVRRSYDQACK